ncbi:CHASE3 domain-containing protein [Phormidium sp. CCY1219]|uniref:CHASE3 domain-containing protein n=1 Tax=Phormidium sp. CCY1219 TaxID=2886104 RepID=UPI002D1EAC20|nr:CHASE3 domain-containing protein [Phormidium sp. CCY1219]MEB3826983.1 CHASE3 domain-containing protein [Phormidium sp. CCY1219]
MLKNLKLRGRIFAGFSIPVLLIVGFSGLVYVMGKDIAEKFKEVNRAQQVLVHTDQMFLRTALMARQVRGYLLTKNEEPLREFEKQKQLYDRAVDVAEDLIVYPE